MLAVWSCVDADDGWRRGRAETRLREMELSGGKGGGVEGGFVIWTVMVRRWEVSADGIDMKKQRVTRRSCDSGSDG